MDLTKNYESDFLLETLSSIASEFEKYNIPTIVGGGFCLYLKSRFFRKERSSRYPNQTFMRSTKDIDIFLTSELIINPTAIENIKSVFTNLNFEVKTKYFQYKKEIKFGDGIKEVLIDLLSQPVPEKDLEKVKIKKPRIRPIDVNEFHAFYHQEAEVINAGLIKVVDYVDPSIKNKFSNVYLLSTFSLIVLKLHAFRDRINDEEKDFGRHHAYDIFSSVIEMDENDWSNCKTQYQLWIDSPVMAESKKIIGEFFNSESSMGIIRLKENQLYNRDKIEYDSYIKSYIEDLLEIFPSK